MYDLTYRQEKIQEKRKQTPFRDYLKEIVSRQPVGFYKNQGLTSRYPVSDRIGKLVPFTEEIDPTKFVIETPSSDFFSDLQQLRRLMPLANLCQYDTITNENALYSDLTAGSRNVYLSIATWIECENVLYAFDVRYLSKNIQNSLCIYQSENIYSSVSVTNGYNVFFSKSINNSSNIRYSIGMNGCSECIECENMDNTSYCIKNQQLTKEEYFTQKEKILKERVKSYQNNFTNLTGKLLERGNTNVQGKFVINSEKIENGFFIDTVKTGRNIILGGSIRGAENYYDAFIAGSGDKLYGIVEVGGAGAPAHHVYCSCHTPRSSNIFYSFFLDYCSFCLGCIGLKNKSYCIFNKQYTKEERHAKVDEIFTQMENDGTLGQFFPATMNPFYFNDTAAYLIDPTFTKEEVEKAGYLRRDEPIKVDIPANLEQVNVRDLDQYEGFNAEGKRTINPDILKKVIIDDAGNCRRIVKMEYDFLVKYGLPLPRKHWLERMKENFRIG